jgi:predicted ester cyclase
MTVDQNKLVVRRYIEEVMNTGNVDRIAEFVSEECVDAHRDHILSVKQTYPDLHLTIDRQIAEGEWVVTQVTAKGTHMGSWLGMRPTGKAVTISAVNVNRLVDGRIVEHGGAANSLEALLEIGAVRVVGTERDDEAARCSEPNDDNSDPGSARK